MIIIIDNVGVVVYSGSAGSGLHPVPGTCCHGDLEKQEAAFVFGHVLGSHDLTDDVT